MSDHKLRQASGCDVIDIAPAYSRQAFVDLLEMVRSIVAERPPRLVLNMEGLPGITSEGIGLLVLVHDECLRSGGRMVLARVPQRVERVLKLAGVVNFFSLHPDEHDAIGALRAEIPDSQAVADAPAVTSAQEPEEEQVDPETALREIVRDVIRSRRHQQVIEFFMKSRMKIASLDEVSGMTSIPREITERVLVDLARGGLVAPDGELFAWKPSPDADKKLKLFKQALSNPRLRSRVLAWVYAEEKKA